MIAAGAIPPSSSSSSAAATSPSVPTRRRPLDPADADPSVDDHSPAYDGDPRTPAAGSAPFARRRRAGRLMAGNWWLTRLLAVALVALLASALLLGTARIGGGGGGGGGAAREQKEEVLLQINAHEESMGWTAENSTAVKRRLHPPVVQLLKSPSI